MSDNMNDLRGWQAIPCIVADILRHSDQMHVFSSLTDLDGRFGEATVYTEWGITLRDGTDAPVLREYLWPKAPDKPCTHYVPEDGAK